MMGSEIYGLETEFGLRAIDDRGVPYLEQVAALIVHKISRHNGFLENGARFYADVGSHPEYATPECGDLYDLIAADKAGEVVALQVLERAAEIIRRNTGVETVQLLKMNLDSIGNTFGCHENYLVARSALTDTESFRKLLIPHLVTRTVMIGAGHMGFDGYVISQRADKLHTEVSGATTRDRGILNTRDESHAESGQRRVHVICGDSNMSEYSTFLKCGTTALVLRLIQEGLADDSLELAEPLKAFKILSKDLSLTFKFRLKSGVYMSAIEIQRAYLKMARERLPGIQFGRFDEVLAIWSEMLGRLERDPMDTAKFLDWTAKLNFLRKTAARRSLSLDHPLLQALSIQYHDIASEGWYSRMRDTGKINTLIDPSHIQERVYTPPLTRAKLRGDFIAWAIKNNISYRVGWDMVYAKRVFGENEAGNTIHIRNPFISEDDRISRIIT